METPEKIDRKADARTRRNLNRLLVVLVLVSVLAGFTLRMLDHAKPEHPIPPENSEEKTPGEKEFDPIPDPIPDPIEIP